MKTKLECPN